MKYYHPSDEDKRAPQPGFFDLHAQARAHLDVNSDPVPFGDVLRLLWSRKTFMHMALGSGLNAFRGYAIANWNAPFLIRG